MKALNQLYLQVYLIALSCICIGVYFIFRNETYFDFLLWNLFLAWIPYALSLAAYWIHQRRASTLNSMFLILCGCIWVLFLPNAPYVITDLIHLTILKNLYVQNGSLSFSYWYDFFVILLFSWIGVILGCSSMYHFHSIFVKYFNRFLSWLIIVLITLLCGYGILLGREYRLNSWDVLFSIRMIPILKESLNAESMIFCMLVGLVWMTIYSTYYLLVNGLGSSNSIRSHRTKRAS
jgi:uncharacterized membrane protein